MRQMSDQSWGVAGVKDDVLLGRDEKTLFPGRKRRKGGERVKKEVRESRMQK